MTLVPQIIDGDWNRLRQVVNKLSSIRLGPTSTPTYAGLTLTGLSGVLEATTGTISGSADHASLGSLTADDHSIYALLAGRSGGQTLSGSDTTAEDLTLEDNTVDGNTITVTQAIAAYTHVSNDGTDHGYIDQDLQTTASPTFVGLTLSDELQSSDRYLFGGITSTSQSWDLSSNCIALYTLNDNEDTSTVIDSSGNGHNGTVVNDETNYSSEQYTASGKINGAFDFDGTNDYVDCGDDDTFTFGDGSSDSPFSISCQANMNDATLFYFIAKHKSTGDVYREWMLYVGSADNLSFAISDHSAGAHKRVESTSAITSYEGSWMHIVGTYDGSGTVSGLKLYINGAQIETSVEKDDAGYVAMENTTTHLTLGRRDTSYSDGKLDAVMIFDKALTGDEVLYLYNQGTGTEETSGSLDFSSISAINDTNIFPSYLGNTADSLLVGGDLEVQGTTYMGSLTATGTGTFGTITDGTLSITGGDIANVTNSIDFAGDGYIKRAGVAKIELTSTGDVELVNEAVLLSPGGIACYPTPSSNYIIDLSSHGSASATYYIGDETIDTSVPSDENLKTDIQDTKLTGDELLSIPIKDFKFIHRNDGMVHTGIMAQDVERVFPMAVRDYQWKDDKTTYKAIRNNRLTPLIIKAIQKLHDRIVKLEG